MTQDAEKALLRRRLLEQRSRIPPAQKYFWENAIARHVLNLPEYRRAELVLAYLAKPEEIDTAVIIAHALLTGKRVAVPRCRPGERRMDFCPFADRRELTGSFYGIPEPPSQAPALAPKELEGAFCVVPALGASPSGHRVGYGGGYYDRFLAEFPGTSAILTYGWSLLESLRPGPLDVAAGIVVTPEAVLRP